MLTCWQPERLVLVLQSEGEDAGVPGYGFFGVEHCFGPGAGVEEYGAGCVVGGSMDGFGEGGKGFFVESADVVVGHHCFGCFAVCGVVSRFVLLYQFCFRGIVSVDVEETYESP